MMLRAIVFCCPLLTGCFHVQPPPSLKPHQPVTNGIYDASEYCRAVANQLDDRRHLNAVGYASFAVLVAAGGTGAISTGLFFSEANEDTPSNDSLETKGVTAIVSTAIAGIAGAVYSYTTKERAARVAASAEIHKTRQLIEAQGQAITDGAPSKDQLALPSGLADACYQVALSNEERGRQAVEQLATEIGKRIRESKAELDKKDAETQQFIDEVRKKCGENFSECAPLRQVRGLQ